MKWLLMHRRLFALPAVFSLFSLGYFATGDTAWLGFTGFLGFLGFLAGDFRDLRFATATKGPEGK